MKLYRTTVGYVIVDYRNDGEYSFLSTRSLDFTQAVFKNLEDLAEVIKSGAYNFTLVNNHEWCGSSTRKNELIEELDNVENLIKDYPEAVV